MNHAKTYIGPWEAQPHATAGRTEGFDERARGRSGTVQAEEARYESVRRALQETSERKGGIIDELTRHAVALSPVIKRRTFPELENVPEGLVLGWAQLPSTRGRGFSLGIFPDRDHFAQVAFADTHGRVFVGTDPNMDVQDMQARFMFGKEKEVTLPDGERLGESDEPRSRSGFSRAGHGLGSALHHGRGLGRGLGHGADGVKAITGGVVGRDDTGRMTWLASWLKAGNRYTLEQMRANLPPVMRHDLGIPRCHYHRVLRHVYVAADQWSAHRIRFRQYLPPSQP